MSAATPLVKRLATALALALWVSLPSHAQETEPKPETPAETVIETPAGSLKKTEAPATTGAKPTKSISITTAQPNAPDYAAWERLATRAESAMANRDTSNQGLELLRSQLVDWRAAFQTAQNANATRISTIRTQIETLGPVPTDGATEAEEIALRRKALTDQLVRLQAPGIAAEEAYTRADGLIKEIDRSLRERQTSELLKLWPSPVNPGNWGLALKGITTSALELYNETADILTGPRAGRDLRDNLPLILLLTAIALLLLWRGRRWINAQVVRLARLAPERGRPLWELLASLGQIIVPFAGLLALSRALLLAGVLGAEGRDIARALPGLGLIVFVSVWLSWRVFPTGDSQWGLLRLPPERRAEGRFHGYVLGLMLTLNALRSMVFPPAEVGEAATSVLSLPILVIAGFSLIRLGSLMRRHVREDTPEGEALNFRNRMIKLVAQGASLIGVIGPLLAAIGYVSAAAAMVLPAGLSLALLAIIFILQQAINDIHALIIRDPAKGDWGLVPVLAGSALALSAIPMFALIWGARYEDLSEIWTKFLEGFRLGDSRISPTDFLYFALLFGIGYTVTRLFQGALKSTILPKTRLDAGGQNAIVSGTGYLGIFLAALVAINAVGIDLSGLAIVAGALSVGIGFGLQNIVSNFVSGIILLIERPVSEGDWIEVGTVSGTVRTISVRSTRIQTFDRSDVIVPNADLVTQRVTNWTRFNLNGRLIVPVNVAHGSNVETVERVLRQIAEAQPLVVLNPAPTIALMGFTMDAMQFEMRLILRDVNFSLKVRSDINHQILSRFAQEQIVMAHTPPNPAALPPPLPASKAAATTTQGGPSAHDPDSPPREPTW
jgi:potassium efflux system protein